MHERGIDLHLFKSFVMAYNKIYGFLHKDLSHLLLGLSWASYTFFFYTMKELSFKFTFSNWLFQVYQEHYWFLYIDIICSTTNR